MLDLYLIRHGESLANTIPHIVGGQSSLSPLTLKGQYQANKLYDYLNDEYMIFDRVISSTAVRAIQTATTAAEDSLQYTPLEVFKDLEELDQGDWEGQFRDQTYTPEILAKIKSDSWNFVPPNGESQGMVADRVSKVIGHLQNVASENKEGAKVAVFMHGYAIKCWLCTVMGFSKSIVYPMTIDNCGMTRLVHDGDLWAVRHINRIA